MTSRFKKQKKIQKWNESVLYTPPSLLQKIADLQSAKLVGLVTKYLQAGSVYGRTERVTELFESIHALDVAEQCSDVVIELLFVEPAKQLHKQILSGLKQFPPINQKKMASLIMDYLTISENPIYKDHEAPLVVLFVTLVESPAVSEALRGTVCECCLFFCRRVRSVLGPMVDQGSTPLPWQLEEAQEIVSVIYALLTQFSEVFNDSEGPLSAHSALALVSETMFWLLQNQVLVNEALPSCGVALWAAISQPPLPPSDAAELIFHGYSIAAHSSLREVKMTPSLVDRHYLHHGSSLLTEFQNISSFSRVCSLRGVVSILSRATLLHLIDNGCLLRCLLEAFCRDVAAALDVSLCFHILCGITTTLERYRDCFTAMKDSPAMETPNSAVPDCCFLLEWEAFELVLASVWRHLEDSVHQTERQAVTVFNTLIDIMDVQFKIFPDKDGVPTTARICESVLEKLMALDVRKKGKYALLAAVVPKFGAEEVSRSVPSLLPSIIASFSEASVSKAASNCFISYLRTLRNELPDRWIQQSWLRDLAEALLSSTELQRRNLTTYILPQLMKMQKDMFHCLLKALLPENGAMELLPSQITVVISLLRVVRQERHIQNLESFVDNANGVVNIPFSLLKTAIWSASESLYLSTLELACVHPKPKDFPGGVNYEIVKQGMLVAMRSADQGMRNKWQALMERFMVRLEIAVSACCTQCRHLLHSKHLPTGPCSSNPVSILAWRDRVKGACDLTDLERSQEFMHWMTERLIQGLYPGAPPHRKIHSVELLCTLLRVWNGFLATERNPLFFPFSETVLSASTVEILLGCMSDPWDYLRSMAAQCLAQFPTPFPGHETQAELLLVLNWAQSMIDSPRLRENDCGARIFTLVYRKYIQSLGWSIFIYPEVKIEVGGSPLSQLDYFASLFDWFADNLQKGERDLLEQCRHGLAHGVLLAVRYAVEATDWTALLKEDNAHSMRDLLKSFFAKLTLCSQLCLSVLHSQDVNVGVSDDEESVDEGEDSMGPDAQLLMTGTWLTIKELSVVLGTMAQHLPIKDVGVPEGSFLLELPDFQAMEGYFLDTLTRLKHNGAVEKTAASFQALTERLLQCHLLEFRELPRAWVEALLRHGKRPHQGRDDIIRRSGGLPFALAGIFRAEPKNIPKALLPSAVQSLVQIVSKSELYSPWTRVHGFHILRHIFNDKALATDAAGVLGEGLQLSLTSMSDAVWEVRSAASLCFGTLVTRMVGYRNAIGNGTHQKSISAFEFFSRYPSVMAFMARELDGVAERMQSANGAVPVSLGPILLLLARLMPCVTPPMRITPGQEPALLLPAIQKCLSVVHMAVRRLAARAIVPLVVKEEVFSHVSRLLDGAFSVLGHDCADNNAVHGHLLAVKTLLTAHSDVLDGEKGTQVLVKLGQLTERTLNGRISAGVRLEFLKLVAMLDTQNSNLTAVRERLVQNCTELLKEEQQTTLDAMQPLFLQECAAFVLQSAHSTPSMDTLSSSLNHPVYEVRLEALRHVYRTLCMGDLPSDVAQWIKTQLNQRLLKEAHSKCVCKCLKALSAARSTHSEEAEGLDLWPVLSRLHTDEGMLKTRQYALLCLGSVFGPYLSASLGSATGNDTVSTEMPRDFAGFVEKAGHYRNPMTLRLSAVEALRRSSVLKVLQVAISVGERSWLQVCPKVDKNTITEELLSLWSLLFVFLEDDDTHIRQSAALLIQELSESSPGSQCLTRNASLAQKDAFQQMTKAFDGQEMYFDYLLGLVVDRSPIEISSDAFSGRVRRLFDKDPDNQQAEILLKCQLAAEHAREQLKHQKKNLTGWADTLQALFSESIQKCKAVETTPCWKGLWTNHERIFTWFYRALLGIWVLLQAREGFGERLESWKAPLLEFQNLCLHRDLVAFSSLILKELTTEVETEPSSYTKEFDPLFLVRQW